MLEAKYMDRKYPKETYRPYKSLEDVPPEVLAILMQDPTFDPETFLKMDSLFSTSPIILSPEQLWVCTVRVAITVKNIIGMRST